jgi:hypothetical protein
MLLFLSRICSAHLLHLSALLPAEISVGVASLILKRSTSLYPGLAFEDHGYALLASCIMCLASFCAASCMDFVSWGYKPHLEVLDKLLACLLLSSSRHSAPFCLVPCRDFVSWGYKPHLKVLDKLLACLLLSSSRHSAPFCLVPCRDFVSWGYKPHLEVLDKLLACLLLSSSRHSAPFCLVPCRDFVSWGYKPHLEVLDKLLACLRLQPPRQPQQQTADSQRAQQLQAQLQPLLPGQAQTLLQEQCEVDDEPCVQQQAILRELANPGERRGGLGLAGEGGDALQERPYEVPFDKRAMDAVLDAINIGLLPPMKVRYRSFFDLRTICCGEGRFRIPDLFLLVQLTLHCHYLSLESEQLCVHSS